ncbi:MAG: YdcF family protein [Thermodesulfobacteriota bacterium]|nr:YdcF family protein [Thermodesulfobacteriota bacterium]
MNKERSWSRRIISALNLILWLAFFIILAIAYTPLTRYMLKPLLVKEDIRKADVIVVLGGGIDEGRHLSLVSSHRLLRGAQLYFEGKVKKILLSGGDPRKVGVAEAMVMAQEARRLNIPAQDIIIEKHSNRTHEQAGEIKKIAKSQRWESLLLVTSYSHMKRSLMAFERAGFKVYPAPADPYEKYIDDPLGRLRLFKLIIYEYGGIVYYKIRGWI